MIVDHRAIEYVRQQWRALDLTTSHAVNCFLVGTTVTKIPHAEAQTLPLNLVRDMVLERYAVSAPLDLATLAWLSACSSYESVELYLRFVGEFLDKKRDCAGPEPKVTTPVPDIEAAIDLVRPRPAVWIGAETLDRLRAFLCGSCLRIGPNKGPTLDEERMGILEDFEEFLTHRFQLAPMRPRWDHVVGTYGAPRELSLFFDLWDEFLSTSTGPSGDTSV